MAHKDGREVHEAAIGTGPIDAVFKCINNIVQEPCSLAEFKVASLTGGTDAVGNVTVSIEPQGDKGLGVRKDAQTSMERRVQYTGHGTETDIWATKVWESARTHRHPWSGACSTRDTAPRRTSW